MKKFRSSIIAAAIIGIAAVVGYLTSMEWGVARGIFWALLICGPILHGMYRIENDPPEKGVVTLFGRRLPFYADEGWHFFFLRPFFLWYVPVGVKRVNFEVSVTTRTPDRAPVKVVVSLTVRPLSEGLIQYLNSGGENGVRSIFEGHVEERIREWVEGTHEGPMDWRELYRGKLEMASVLAKRIAGNGSTIPGIPETAQGVPTHILLLFFSKPRPSHDSLARNEKPWAEDDWARVREVVEKGLSDTTKKEIADAVEARRKKIQDLRAGSGKIEIPDIGIRLERLNITDVEVMGDVKKAADAAAREREEGDGEKRELRRVMDRIEDLGDRLAKKFPNLQISERMLSRIIDMVQVERGKATRNINTLDIPPEVFAAAREFLGRGGAQ
ncbi:hypothetical protein A2110_02705 [Candidatus Jorgensenbacteria bacterium GWA1_54_12]|uniref:Band 7 domain-containing protein n=1 Tax=Candidatus Jorgensenbacteria bacterium GWA1_54_12 TaxID=1798468 RepID=A0A1F6BKN6_9BACT|nr:MAG: hypothetical protein A2110_02705 [Candidatus Jorgensenbacteria bacterium GWA1_54_12]